MPSTRLINVQEQDGHLQACSTGARVMESRAHLGASRVQQHVCNAPLKPTPASRVPAPVPVTGLPARKGCIPLRISNTDNQSRPCRASQGTSEAMQRDPADALHPRRYHAARAKCTRGIGSEFSPSQGRYGSLQLEKSQTVTQDDTAV